MTVEELVEKLQGFPPTMRVLGRGYESGWNDLDEVVALDVYHVPTNPWYDGKYQNYVWDEKFTDQSTAVCLN